VTNKNKPQECKSEMHCKATASLKKEVEEELIRQDASLQDLLAKKEEDENKDS